MISSKIYIHTSIYLELCASESNEEKLNVHWLTTKIKDTKKNEAREALANNFARLPSSIYLKKKKGTDSLDNKI